MIFSINRSKSHNNLNINDADFNYKYQGNGYEWYINGVLFYIVNKKSIVKSEKITNKLIDSLFKDCNLNPNKINDALEGHYICIIKQENQIKVFGDSFNRRNLFYYEDKQLVYFSTRLTKDLIEKCNKKIDSMYLLSYLMIGYGHATTTIFEKIHRLGYKEYLLFKDKLLYIKKEFNPFEVESYGDRQLQLFEKLFKESISARMAKKGTNWLMTSSGWDSTLILDTLLKLTDKNKVKTATSEVQFRNGQILNIFETEKVDEITSHYNIENKRFHVDLNDKKLVDLWKKYTSICFENQIFHWPINQLGVIDLILKYDSNVSSIFNGECADSFQNFGFSQYSSIHSGNNNFDEYADKMKTYLYGPEFFNEVKNGKFRKNVIYQIFKKMNPNIDFNDESKDKNNYLNVMLSFIYSPTRLPFTLSKNCPFLRDDVLKNFYNLASKTYFERYYKILESRNIYSIWNALYADFHFKGSTLPINIVGIENLGLIAALPFFDIRLAKYFAKMPEEYGRGLNFNRLKYPEKTMAVNSKTYPIHIVDKRITHSYISEEDAAINPYFEYYCNSSIGDYFKEILSQENSLNYIKNIKGIDTNYINKIKKDYLDEKILMKDFPFISKICILTSMIIDYL